MKAIPPAVADTERILHTQGMLMVSNRLFSVVVESVKTRREEYAEQTRAALLDAAAEAFARDGFTAASITQIAASARVTKGAVYHHFADKHCLFEAVFNRYNDVAQRRVYDAMVQHPADPWQAALTGLEATLDVCMDRVAARLIYIEGPVGLGWRRWRESEEHYTRRNIRLLLESLVEAGTFRDDISPAAMAQLLTGMLTRIGITLAEAPARKRRKIRTELQTAMLQLLDGLRHPAI